MKELQLTNINTESVWQAEVILQAIDQLREIKDSNNCQGIAEVTQVIIDYAEKLAKDKLGV